MQCFEALRNGHGVPADGDGTAGGLNGHRGRNLRTCGAGRGAFVQFQSKEFLKSEFRGWVENSHAAAEKR